MKLHMQTPHEARMCPIDFEVKRSRSQCINYWKWFPAHNCFPFTPIIMKLHMQTPHEARMCPIDFEVQRSRSQCINYWKWFPAHNCFPFTPIIMKLHMQTPHEARMCPIDFEVKRSKVKVTMHKLLKMVSGAGGISPVRTDPDLVLFCNLWQAWRCDVGNQVVPLSVCLSHPYIYCNI